jgi:hypothetical protein
MPTAAPIWPEALEKRSTIAPAAKWSAAPDLTRPRAVGMKPAVAWFGQRTIPVREPPFDRAALLRRQWRCGQVPVLFKPGHDLAVGRIDEPPALDRAMQHPLLGRGRTSSGALAEGGTTEEPHIVLLKQVIHVNGMRGLRCVEFQSKPKPTPTRRYIPLTTLAPFRKRRIDKQEGG